MVQVDEVWSRICLTQLLNCITVFFFYLIDNPIRNVVISGGFPVLFCTIFVYICAPLTAAYLVTYLCLSALNCVYNCIEGGCMIMHSWCSGVITKCTWKSSAARQEHVSGVAGRDQDAVSVISGPPSYHSSLPPHLPRSTRNQEAELTLLRGALSNVRQPGGADTCRGEMRQAMRVTARLYQIDQGITTPPPPPYQAPPPQYNDVMATSVTSRSGNVTSQVFDMAYHQQQGSVLPEYTEIELGDDRARLGRND